MHEAVRESQADIVRSWCCAFLGDKPGLVMVMRVYMDESNTHDGTEWLTVSAAWADADTWAAWTEDWLKAIAPLHIFHSADVARLDRAENWSRSDVNALVERAMAVIAKHKIYGRIGVIHRTVFAHALRERPEVVEHIGHDYFVPFIWAARRSLKILKESGHSRIAFFHEGNDFEANARIQFSNIAKSMGMDNSSITFGLKCDFVPLQCADVFAYEGMKQRMCFPNGEGVRKPWEAMLQGSNRVMYANVTDEQIRELANDIIQVFDAGELESNQLPFRRKQDRRQRQVPERSE